MNQLKRPTWWLLFIISGPVGLMSLYASQDWDYLVGNPWGMLMSQNGVIFRDGPLVTFLAAVHGSTVYRTNQVAAESISARPPWVLALSDALGAVTAVAVGWVLLTAVSLLRAFSGAADGVELPVTLALSSFVFALLLPMLGVALGRGLGKVAGPLVAVLAGLYLYQLIPLSMDMTLVGPYTAPDHTVSWTRLGISTFVVVMIMVLTLGVSTLRLNWLRHRGPGVVLTVIGVVFVIAAWGTLTLIPRQVPRAQPEPVCSQMTSGPGQGHSVCVWPEDAIYLPYFTQYAEAAALAREYAGYEQVDFNETGLNQVGQQFPISAMPDPYQYASLIAGTIVPSFMDESCPRASDEEIMWAEIWLIDQALDGTVFQDQDYVDMVGEFGTMSDREREAWLRDRMPDIASCMPYSTSSSRFITADEVAR